MLLSSLQPNNPTLLLSAIIKISYPYIKVNQVRIKRNHECLERKRAEI
jgi:hypothetical protein